MKREKVRITRISKQLRLSRPCISDSGGQRNFDLRGFGLRLINFG